MPKTKIAFLDVDQTLVDNRSSEYNENLIHYLNTHQFDEVYLVTGRNTNDFWQHVLHMGRIPPNWRDQLLCNVVRNLKDRGINVVGVSTPYDHYIMEKAAEAAPELWSKISKSGDFAEQIYMPFEETISALSDSEVTLNTLHKKFGYLTKGDIYDSPFGDKCSLTEALLSHLVMTEDTEKKGQFELLLQRVEAEHEGELEVFFFDDKPENLATAQALFGNHKRVTSHVFLVPNVQNYMVPDDLITPASNDSSSVSVDSRIPNTCNVSLIEHEGALVPCFPSDRNLEHYFRENKFEVFAKEGQSALYMKDYTPEEQAVRDGGNDFHPDYNLQGFFDFIKAKKQDEHCYYRFELSLETQSTLSELTDTMTEEEKTAFKNAFPQEFAVQKFESPLQDDNNKKVPHDTSRETFMVLLDRIKEKRKSRLEHYPDANRAVEMLVKSIEDAATVFYNAEPTAASLQCFKTACTRAIEANNDVLGTHRKTFGKLFASIKNFFIVLAKTLSCSGDQERTHRMKFFDTRTDSAKILQDLAEDINETIVSTKSTTSQG